MTDKNIQNNRKGRTVGGWGGNVKMMDKNIQKNRKKRNCWGHHSGKESGRGGQKEREMGKRGRGINKKGKRWWGKRGRGICKKMIEEC